MFDTRVKNMCRIDRVVRRKAGSSSKPSAGSDGTARNNICRLHNIDHSLSMYVKICVLNSYRHHLKFLFLIQDGTHCTFITKTKKKSQCFYFDSPMKFIVLLRIYEATHFSYFTDLNIRARHKFEL